MGDMALHCKVPECIEPVEEKEGAEDLGFKYWCPVHGWKKEEDTEVRELVPKVEGPKDADTETGSTYGVQEP